MAGESILLVEDEALIALSEKAQLERYGYRVFHSLTGEAAVEIALKDQTTDLVLMDIDLGNGIDGTEAARQILAGRTVPLIFVSSHTDRAIVERTEGITSYGYVVKNSGITVLDAAIKMAFRLYAANTELNATNEKLYNAYEELQVSSEELQKTLTDVLERETELRASEERFRSMVEHAPIPIIIHTAAVIRYANPPAVTLLGGSAASDIVGTPVVDRIDGRYRALAEQELAAIVQGRRTVPDQQELLCHALDGDDVWVSISTRPLTYQGERAILTFLEDIGERRRHRAELQAWNDLFAYIITHNNSAIAILDTELIFLYISDRFRRDYRVPDDETIVGRHHYDVFPDIPEKWRAVHRRALAGEVQSSEEDRFERLDGTVDYTRWEARPWYRSPGEIGGIVIYTDVITDQVERRIALERSEERARGAVTEKEVLLRELNHRIRNNLATLSSMISLHAEAAQNEGHQRAATALEEIRQRMLSLQLLYDQLHNSTNDDRVPLCEYVHSLVRQTVDLFPFGAAVTLDFACQSVPLTPTILAPLGIIVNELATNAMKYGMGDRGAGAISLRGEVRSDGTMTITLRDDGPGLPPAGERTDGLGLSIVNALAEQIGGSIDIASDHGAVATLTFPIPTDSP